MTDLRLTHPASPGSERPIDAPINRLTPDATALAVGETLGTSPEWTFRLMVECVKDYAIFMLDPTGRVATWNAGAKLIKGYEAEEIIGKHFSVFYTEEDARTGHCEAELATARRTGRFEEEGWRVRKDGSRFWANVVITAMHDSSGALRGFAKVTRDLTERKQAEDRLRGEMTQRLNAEQQANLAQLFIGVLSHDLRNPLNAVMMSAAMLGRLDPTEKQAQLLTRMSSSCHRIEKMVEELLDFTRMGIGGGVSLNPRPCDLTAICDRVLGELSVVDRDRRIQVHAEGDATGAWDSGRLEQVVSNLVGNALKHGDPNAPIRVSIDGREDPVRFSVQNGGVIDPALLPALFAPFKNTRHRGSRSQSGLGLGLFITHEIVEAHGGTVEVRSTLEEGTVLAVALPRNG